jgi:hypothetical protein
MFYPDPIERNLMNRIPDQPVMRLAAVCGVDYAEAFALANWLMQCSFFCFDDAVTWLWDLATLGYGFDAIIEAAEKYTFQKMPKSSNDKVVWESIPDWKGKGR